MLVNEEEQSAVVDEVARTVVDPDKVITRAKPKMGSEDFADMMQVVPGAYFWIGHDGSVPVHNPGYVLDDKILPIGASMFARIIETRLPAGRPCIKPKADRRRSHVAARSFRRRPDRGLSRRAVLAVRSAGGSD